MQLITCPDKFTDADGCWRENKVFLGGGITGCPDWQQELIGMLSSADDKLVLINPRRDSFDVNDPASSEFQIEWEYRHLHLADAIVFWFPCETLCPITLYELGAAATRGAHIIVGCHPDYKRAFDVKKQLSLIRPNVTVHDNLIGVAQGVLKWYRHLRFGYL